MAQPTSIIQADFDRLALLSEEGWDHNSHYHRFLLRHAPPHCQAALEVGCGTGAFARLLAQRSDRVLALDVSPQMIRLARERSGQFPHIDFRLADVSRWEFPSERFDCIATIATLHHLPLKEMLLGMKQALKTQGRLLILDLFQREGIFDLATNALAIPSSVGLRLTRRGRLRPPRAVRAAWAAHERHDSLLTLTHIRRACEDILPGAKLRKHLLWRYSIVWTKPEK